MGITDVDDKIINRATELKYNTLSEVNAMVRRLENDFLTDMDQLNVRRPDAVLRVSEHIPQIVDYIATIQRQGYAYLASDGVYFDVQKHGTEYGKLGGVPPNPCLANVDEISITAPMSVSTSTPTSPIMPTTVDQVIGSSDKVVDGKRDWRDFALWKNVKPEDGPVYWESPWGPGRPGWHIECSAMTHAYFGTKLDIHSGGIDLKFPHHTNEIAQW